MRKGLRGSLPPSHATRLSTDSFGAPGGRGPTGNGRDLRSLENGRVGPASVRRDRNAERPARLPSPIACHPPVRRQHRRAPRSRPYRFCRAARRNSTPSRLESRRWNLEHEKWISRISSLIITAAWRRPTLRGRMSRSTARIADTRYWPAPLRISVAPMSTIRPNAVDAGKLYMCTPRGEEGGGGSSVAPRVLP